MELYFPIVKQLDYDSYVCWFAKNRNKRTKEIQEENWKEIKRKLKKKEDQKEKQKKKGKRIENK